MRPKRLIPAEFLLATLLLLSPGSSSAQEPGASGHAEAPWNGREPVGSPLGLYRTEPRRTAAGREGASRARRGAGTVDSMTVAAAGGGQESMSVSAADGAGGVIEAWMDYRSDSCPEIYVQRLNAAGVPQWTANGVAVCTTACEQSSPALVSDGASGAIVVWVAARDGSSYSSSSDIYAQRVSADGVPQWTASGVAVCAAAYYQGSPALVADGAGGAIFAWEDWRGPDIYAQRVSADGVPQWTADGVAVCTAEDGQYYPALVADGAGGAIMAWADQRSGWGHDTYVQRLSAEGVPQWTANGVMVGEMWDRTTPALVADGAGGAIVTWGGYAHYGSDIYAERLNAAGVPQWSADGWGVPICAVIGSQRYPALVADGAGGAIATWQDERSGYYSDIYAQRLSADGVPQWTADGVMVCAAAGFQDYPALVTDGTGGVLVTWEDAGNGYDYVYSSFNYSIYAQRLSADGVPQWTADGVAVCPAAHDQQHPTLVTDGAGGAIVTWEDRRSVFDLDTYAQRLSGSGALVWAADGVPVHLAPGVQLTPVCAPSPGGGAIVAWSEKRGSNYDIFARKFDAAGAPSWPAVVVCTMAGAQVWPQAIADGAGGAFVTWMDRRGGGSYFDIYAQRVSAGGVPQWTANGVAVCTAAYEQSNPALVSNGAGGIIVTWEDWRGGYAPDIYAQRLSAHGAPQWPINGVVVCTAWGTQRYPALISDGAGGAIVTWEDWRGGYYHSDVYAQRLIARGTPQWAADGVAVCTAAGGRVSPALIADGAGGAMVTWADARNDPHDIYAQRLSAGGARQWAASGVAVCTTAGEQSSPALALDDAGGVIVTWQDARSGPYDIYAQRLSAAGAPQWVTNGVAVCAATGSQWSQAMVSDGSGGAIVTWTDERSGSDIYAQRLSARGVPQWTANGLAVCTAAYRPSNPAVASDSEGGAIVAWMDRRGETDSYLYTQRLNGSGTSLWFPLLSLVSATAELERVRLEWRAAGSGIAQAMLYRRGEDTGWSRLTSLSADGAGRLLYEDREIKPGTRYGYRLGIVEDGAERFLGEIWVTVPLPVFTLALHGVRPNPAIGNDLTVWFTLPTAEPALLELFDVSGRRIAAREVGTFGMGPHSVELTEGRKLAPGVYLVRLTQSGKALVARAAVIR